MAGPSAQQPALGENPHAGEGAVLLDIGGDVGALVVRMPSGTLGLEVEIRPAGATGRATTPSGESREAHHHHDHDHDHHDHHDLGTQDHVEPRHPHVAVVARPARHGVQHSLVYEAVTAGEYELYPLPAGPVVLTVSVEGGVVTRADWPA